MLMCNLSVNKCITCFYGVKLNMQSVNDLLCIPTTHVGSVIVNVNRRKSWNKTKMAVKITNSQHFCFGVPKIQ
jgi:hypothetical protein